MSWASNATRSNLSPPVQNPEGWSDLNKKDDTANTGAAAGAPGAAAVDASAPTEAVDAVPDDLWSDFEAAATQKKDIEANRNAEIEKLKKNKPKLNKS